MRKLATIGPGTGPGPTHLFWCPGCERTHGFSANRWIFNGDLEQPTVSPSILSMGSAWEGWRCHSFITDGRIQFLDDCTHALAGQTVELPAWP